MRLENIEPDVIKTLYDEGVDYKKRILLYDTVSTNERFFVGDQWYGVNAPDLPKPVINFIKRAVQQKVAEVNSNPVGVNFDSPEFPHEVPLAGEETRVDDSSTRILNTMFDCDWKRMKMDPLCLDGLQDAAISGDFILYSYWNSEAKTGQLAEGQIETQLIDNVNFYPGNPNETDIQKQPYIIIISRELKSDVIKEAENNGITNDELLKIDGDTKNDYQSGDFAKKELYGDENLKCLTFTYLFKKDGYVLAEKTTEDTIIKPIFNTMLKRYPIAMMNWERRKNCCHGRAEITGLISSQRYINQMYAMAMLFTMQSALPKAVYNQAMVKGFSNTVGSAVPVNGDINSAIKYLDPPKLSTDVYDLPQKMLDETLQMVGITDVDLGNINPTNTSAIILAREASSMPVNSIKQRFYSLIDDFARNWLDMVYAYETVPRFVKVKDKSGATISVFDPEIIKDKTFSVIIEVGSANAWSEISCVSTLSSLFSSGVINAREYVERLPQGYVPMREKLISELNLNSDEKGENQDGE